MASIVWDDVVFSLPAPELASLGIEAQTDILAFVNETFNVDRLGGEDNARLRRARMLLAAHMATVSLLGGVSAAGPVLSESTSKISRTYANLMLGVHRYSGSSYGDELDRLINASLARFPLVG